VSNRFDDLALIDAAAMSLPWQMPSDAESTPTPDQVEARAPYRFESEKPAPSPSQDLPLFGVQAPDDRPLITKPSPPRQPLAVRRSTPEVPRARTENRAPLLDLSGPPFQSGTTPPAMGTSAGAAGWPDADESAADPASVPARIAAVAIDLAILAAIDAVVVYFTMQICGLTLADLHILPKGPLITFLLVQNGGYLVAFTAGGQTLGKMAMGIKVVSMEGGASVDVPRSLLRTFVWVLLAVPAGLGFLTALVGAERRGLHDRCAGTRVIKGVC
jgi:uncharacterized RDD family membrane protein YckC